MRISPHHLIRHVVNGLDVSIFAFGLLSKSDPSALILTSTLLIAFSALPLNSDSPTGEFVHTVLAFLMRRIYSCAFTIEGPGSLLNCTGTDCLPQLSISSANL